MHNNKGQSLVLFVLLIPIFLFIFIMVFDVGNMILFRRTLDNINYIALNFGLSHMDSESLENDIKEIINNNDNEINVYYKLENNVIYLETEKDYRGIFLGLLKTKISKVRSSYKGYFDNEKRIIERNK